jgi:HAD superfamily hydrolase (TIGR01509 family)
MAVRFDDRPVPRSAPGLVIFDCDGVLVDSERISHEVLLEMLAERGHRISFEEAVATFMGSSMQRTLELVEAMVQVPPEEFLPAFRTRTFEAFTTLLQPVAGVPELLDSLGTPFCVASNGPREKMTLTLTRTGLMRHFAGRMFSADDVARPKPAPDLFLLAAARLGVEPASCVVVEDSPTGVRAARAAGMAVFGYAALTSAARLREAGAQRVFDRMQDLPALLGLAADGA